MNNKRSFFLIVISIVVISLPPIFYILNFWGTPLSSENIDWGEFGSYIGGILTPILSVITILILIFQQINYRKENEKYKKEKIVNTYIDLLFKAEEKLSNTEEETKKFLPPRYQRVSKSENPKNTGDYQIIWDFVDDWILYKKIQDKIALIDPENPVISYAKNKYKDILITLESLKYIKLNKIYTL